MEGYSRTTTACGSCHRRKIKCDGLTPSCSQCRRRRIQCEPHHRVKRSGVSVEEEARLRQRVSWLENELARACGLAVEDIRNLPTGSVTTQVTSEINSPSPQVVSPATIWDQQRDTATVEAIHEYSPQTCQRTRHESISPVDKEVGDIAADVAVLSLNATGEMRFMGGASGVLFSKLVASTVKTHLYDSDLKSLGPAGGIHGNLEYPSCAYDDTSWRTASSESTSPPIEIARGLLQSYLLWVHVLYPIFHRPVLHQLVESVCRNPQHSSYADKTTFYLIMALGAWHQRFSRDEAPNPEHSAAHFFSCAMSSLENVLPLDGIGGVQIILLLAIYGSYRPTGSSQWHLLGIAMRLCIDMGLHRHNPDWQFTPREWDIRRRLFWVTYAMDRTVCFNLGRPLTLSDDHIDAMLPDDIERESDGIRQSSIALAIHHVRLRRIQSRIITEIYASSKLKTAPGSSDAQRLQLQADIQEQLNDWQRELPLAYNADDTPHSLQFYERLYYTTTASLHRATPLFPVPSYDCLQRCYKASAKAVSIYYNLLRSHEMEQSWMLIHGCFMAGIEMLWTIWASEALSRTVALEEVIESCRRCSNVLAVLSARWKASSGFSDTFELLSNITTKKLVVQLQQGSSSNAPASGGNPVPRSNTTEQSSHSISRPTDPYSLDSGVSTANPELSWLSEGLDLDMIAATADHATIPGFFENIFSGQNTFLNM